MNAPLAFPGGVIELPAPTRELLTDSAMAWLMLAQTQVGKVEWLIEQERDPREVFAAIAVLRSQMVHVRNALTEAK